MQCYKKNLLSANFANRFQAALPASDTLSFSLPINLAPMPGVPYPWTVSPLACLREYRIETSHPCLTWRILACKKNKNKLMEKSLKYKCIVKMRAWAKYLQTLLTKWYPHWLTIHPMSLGYFYSQNAWSIKYSNRRNGWMNKIFNWLFLKFEDKNRSGSGIRNA